MASTTRVRSASALVALCLGFTGSTIAWADGSHGDVRDRWVENPYQSHDTTGTEVRLGSLVGIMAVDGTEYTGLGGSVAAGHRWGRLALDAEYSYLEITERGPSAVHYGTTHAVGVNVRFEVIRLGSRVVGPNSMAALFVEGSLARQFRVADPHSPLEMKPHLFPSGQSNQVSGGFGVLFDHRLEQPRGFPNRVGWQLGWRVIGSPKPEPGTYTTCRGADCTATSRSTGMMEIGLGETSLELSSSIAFTW
jgi:hypothetical protein